MRRHPSNSGRGGQFARDTSGKDGIDAPGLPPVVPVLPAPRHRAGASLGAAQVTAALVCSASYSPELREDIVCDPRLHPAVMDAIARRERTPWCETWHAQALLAGHPALTRRAAVQLARSVLASGIDDEGSGAFEVAFELTGNDRVPRRWRNRVDDLLDPMV